MNLSAEQKALLRALPGVDRMIELARQRPEFDDAPNSVLVNAIRTALEALRHQILSSPGTGAIAPPGDEEILQMTAGALRETLRLKLKPLVNATGVVVHTNLGRSLLADEALENIAAVARSYSNLEYDLDAGRRGSRYSHVEALLCEITGAEAAMVVNNCAGAVLLCLDTVARGRKVVVSRGELVEIGGSFRVPDVMAKSGAILAEVGTTNRTHLRDYENAIDENTALLLKVHRSNFSVVGFTAEVSLAELAELGRRHGIPVMEDLGSGTFIDFSRYGLAKETTVQESVNTRADLVTFSGDKLLGGPQAGIILGQKKLIDRVKLNPVTRALRIDKLTLAAFESTLRLYRDEQTAVSTIPTLRMLVASKKETAATARRLMDRLSGLGHPALKLELRDLVSKAGGGALPLLELQGTGVQIQIEGISANRIQTRLRRNEPPIIGRIENDCFLIDPRTLLDDDFATIADAFDRILKEFTDDGTRR
jgi:L-seryl-tRNA(Ser) seleniumtransferase